MKANIQSIREILSLYGFDSDFSNEAAYLDRKDDNGHIKLIFSVTLADGRKLVIKILRETDDLSAERHKIESQSRFSEFMRVSGISTPRRYKTDGGYCGDLIYEGIPCIVTVEDHCGEELKEISEATAYSIGGLMARMHTVSLANGLKIGCGTLFSAAYENDVDAYERFCEICRDERLDQGVISEIKRMRDEKLKSIRDVWDDLPKAAVQGDISINNLSVTDDEITIFDYNNAGDEALVSDMVLEGLLTAYEMELHEGAPPSCRSEMELRRPIFSAFVKGYLSVRRLSEREADTARKIYTLYNALWFTKILYNDDSLERLAERGSYAEANAVLSEILRDLSEENNGMFVS